jgi:predicted alpha/beta-hydrolase family hydrolase
MEPRELRIALEPSGPAVSALLLLPVDAAWLLVLAHGAGAGMRHPFLAGLAGRLAEQRIATLRYRFPYREAGRRRPDHASRLEATVRSVMAAAAELAPDLQLLAGGKSMGGRMTSRAVAVATPPRLRGLVFFGFPLHPAGRPGVERAEHLSGVRLPMLFLQGDRDRLAELELLRPVCRRLGERAALRVIAGADHGFHVLKRSGRDDAEVLAELAAATAAWAAGLYTDPLPRARRRSWRSRKRR